MKTIKMKEFLKVFDDFSRDKITFEEFNEYAQKNLKVTSYIGLMKKREIVEKIYSKLDKLNVEYLNGIGVSVEAEVYMMMYGLLAYTNIEVDEDDVSIVNYDILMESRVALSILSVCESDYRIIKDMLMQTIVVNMMIAVKDVFSGKLADKNAKQLKELNKIIENKKGMEEVFKAIEYSNPSK